MSKDSGGGTQTVEQRTIPEEFMQYYTGEGGVIPVAYQEFLGREYTPYTGERIAGMTPLQEQAVSGVAGLEAPEELGTAAGVMGAVAGASLGSQYTPLPFFSTYTPTGYESGYEAEEMTSPYEARTFDTAMAEQYMSPYQRAVIDQQKRAATEEYGKLRTQLGAQAAQAGAFGSRLGVQEAETAEDYLNRMADIEATGMQQAYEQARAQFGAEEAMRQQEAEMAMSAQQQTEAARQAEESARLAGARLSEEQAQFAETALQNVLTSQEAANQFAATYGQQGLQTALMAGEAMQNLAQTQQALDLARYQAQYAMGRDQQLLAQARLDQAYQDFKDAQNYTREGIAAMHSILSGTPIPETAYTTNTGTTSSLAQLLGAGTAAIGAYQATS